jgi:hypothetical protein
VWRCPARTNHLAPAGQRGPAEADAGPWPRRCGLLAVTATVAALACFQAASGDLGFHLATGRAILALGHLPTTNVLTFAEPQQPWVLQQAWPAVIFELMWRAGGIAAVTLLKMAVVVATFALMFLSAGRLGAAPAPAALVVVLAAWSSAFRFVERPLIFTNLLLALVGFCLASAARRPAAAGWSWPR